MSLAWGSVKNHNAESPPCFLTGLSDPRLPGPRSSGHLVLCQIPGDISSACVWPGSRTARCYRVPSGDVLAAVAPKIELGTSKTGTLAPGEVAFFQIDPTTDGRLVARVHAEGATTRLSLLDGQGQVLMQSDGQSPANQDDQIDLHVPAGTPAAQRASFWRDVIQTDPALTVLRRRLRSIELSGTGTSAASSASTPSNEQQSYAELGTASGPREGAR